MQIVMMHDAQDQLAAVKQVLADADGFADWLSGQCLATAPVTWTRMISAAAEDFCLTQVHKLLALAADGSQPPLVRCAAMDAITARYLADEDTQARVISEANAIAAERAAVALERKQELAAEAVAVLGYRRAA